MRHPRQARHHQCALPVLATLLWSEIFVLFSWLPAVSVLQMLAERQLNVMQFAAIQQKIVDGWAASIFSLHCCGRMASALRICAASDRLTVLFLRSAVPKDLQLARRIRGPVMGVSSN